jgi:transposase-like protein
MPNHRRRSFTPRFNAQVVLEVFAGLKNPSEIARQHKRKSELIARWKGIAPEGLETLFQGGEQQAQDLIAELERMMTGADSISPRHPMRRSIRRTTLG